ncbi:MAG: ABC transporter permease [Bifidobacteriaceae bacterium]|jgi:hypothetical protein|nr:ABC transporter permease [Bifidobacteriaceae bacterium]
MNKFLYVCKSEFVKLRSIKVTYACSIIALLCYWLIAAGVIILGFTSPGTVGKSNTASFFVDAGFNLVVSGAGTAVIAVVILAILLMSTEYSSGSITSTLIATPNRTMVFWAKTVIIFIYSYVLGIICSILTWLVCVPFMINVDGQNVIPYPNGLADWAMFFGNPLYMGFVAIFCYFIAVIFKTKAIPLVTYFVLFFILPSLLAVATSTAYQINQIVGKVANVCLAFAPSETFKAFIFSNEGAFVTNSNDNLLFTTKQISVDDLPANKLLSQVFSLTHISATVVTILWLALLCILALNIFKKRNI